MMIKTSISYLVLIYREFDYYLKENDQKGMAEKKKEFYEKLEEALNLLELKEQN